MKRLASSSRKNGLPSANLYIYPDSYPSAGWSPSPSAVGGGDGAGGNFTPMMVTSMPRGVMTMSFAEKPKGLHASSDNFWQARVRNSLHDEHHRISSNSEKQIHRIFCIFCVCSVPAGGARTKNE